MSDAEYILPYWSQSPTLRKRIEYKNYDDVNSEIERILNEQATKKFGIGQSLFYQIPFFCNPRAVIPDWCWEMINDYCIATKYNVPLGENLGSILAWQLDCFSIIESEISNINTHERKKNGD